VQEPGFRGSCIVSHLFNSSVVEPCGMDILTAVGIGMGWIKKTRYWDGIGRDNIFLGFLGLQNIVFFFRFCGLYPP
jgi:hypothetical protein